MIRGMYGRKLMDRRRTKELMNMLVRGKRVFGYDNKSKHYAVVQPCFKEKTKLSCKGYKI